jgi:ATP-dependent RNA helicase DDX49/DBP8
MSDIQLFGKKRKRKKKKRQREANSAGVSEGDFNVNAEETSFESLKLSNWLIKSLNGVGITYPTGIQRHCIKPSLSKSCNIVIGSAPTGSGKTAAFALPILEKLSEEPYGIFSIVLTPTRELAIQISKQFNVFGKPINIKVCTVIGGQSILDQSLELSNHPHIVVATPGRFADHLISNNNNHKYNLSKLKYLVLDECDRLLDRRELNDLSRDIKRICKYLPNEYKRKTLFYTATFTDDVTDGKDFVKKYAKGVCIEEDVENLKIFEWHHSKEKLTPESLIEDFVLAPEQIKTAYLSYIIRHYGPEEHNGLIETGIIISKKAKQDKRNAKSDSAIQEVRERPKSMIIFTSTIKTCQLLAELLQEMDVFCKPMHSQMSQSRRIKTIEQFKSGFVKILISTDVGSRGLDLPKVDMVLNYDVPRQPDNYIHRVGRTARIGRPGYALTIITQHEVDLIHAIEEKTTKKLKELQPKVDEQDVVLLLNRTTKAMLNAKLKLANNGFLERNEELANRKKKKYAKIHNKS